MKRILFIEDDRALAEVLSALIKGAAQSRRWDVEIVRQETWSGGMELLHRQQFDAVLLDLALPDSAAHETIRRLELAGPALPPVIIVTGSPLTHLQRLFDCGVQDILWKSSVQCDPIMAFERIWFATMRREAFQNNRHHAAA